jgi:hypothetical protein
LFRKRGWALFGDVGRRVFDLCAARPQFAGKASQVALASCHEHQLAPRLAASRAVARPIPLVAPVITIVCLLTGFSFIASDLHEI